MPTVEHGQAAQAGSDHASQEEKAPGLHESVFEELRSTLQELERVTQMRAARRNIQYAIEDHPWIAVSTAMVAGALVTSLLMPRRESTLKVRGHDTHIPMRYVPDAMQNMQMPSMASFGMASPPGMQPLSTWVERVIDNISRIDPDALKGPVFERMREWAGALMRGKIPGST